MLQNTKAIGKIGEDAAEKYLKKRGWKIISRNFSAHGGEIDIICYRFGTLVLCEVKTRSGTEFGRPSDAVDEEKISYIKTAAAEFRRAYMPLGYLRIENIFGASVKKPVFKTRIDVAEVYCEGGKITKIILRKDWEKSI